MIDGTKPMRTDAAGDRRLGRRAVLGGAAGAAAAGLVTRLGAPIPAAAQGATPVVEEERGVAYGEADGRPLLLDAFRPPARDQPGPAVVVFPGWGASRSAMTRQAKELVEAGYVAFVVAYRWEWPEFLDDAQLAVRWVRANADRYGVDPERICAYGHDIGGQLAAMLAARDTRDEADPALSDYSSRVACAVDLAGISDPTIPDHQPDETWVAWVAEELGGTPEEAPEAYRDVSPIAFVDAGTAPMLVVHGDEDDTGPIEQSRWLVAALEAARVEVVYVEIAGENHFTVASWAVNGPFALAFLDEHLQPER